MATVRANIRKWIKEPATWLSLFAFITSAITFFCNLPRPPALNVLLSNKLGLGVHANELEFVVPLFLYNTGSPGKSFIVEDATAIIVLILDGKTEPAREFSWRDIQALVPRDKYPGAKQTDQFADYFVPEARNVPFAVEGRKTEFKYFRFAEELRPMQSPKSLSVKVTVTVYDIAHQPFSSEEQTYHFSETAWQRSLAGKEFSWPD